MTKHSPDCKRVFKKYDPECPRCQELAAGASPRKGWQADYYSRKQREESSRERAHAAHFAPGGPHARGECGPVCTFGDW